MAAEHSIVAIDGPSASGKSTVARRVAEALGWIYVDSGALYRGVAWQCRQDSVPVDNADAVGRLAAGIHFQFSIIKGAVEFSINGVVPGAALREQSVNDIVSRVAAIPAVRSKVVSSLRDMRRFGNLVMEGRDIGTAVFPDAYRKFYLDASLEERSRRRFLEMRGGSQPVTAESVGDSLARRDAIDRQRKMDPLKVAPDAIVLDSTSLTIEQVVQTILERLRSGMTPAKGV